MQPQPKSSWTDEQNLGQAKLLKDQGNSHFKSKCLKQSLRSYHKALLHLGGILTEASPFANFAKPLASQSIKKQTQQLKFSILMNMVQIYILQDKHERGLEALAKAEKIQTNAKFYYRRAVCLMKVSEFERARADIKQLMDLDPAMKEEGQHLSTQLQDLEKQQDKKSKALFQKFFK